MQIDHCAKFATFLVTYDKFSMMKVNCFELIFVVNYKYAIETL